jgi:hypothetical protein
MSSSRFFSRSRIASNSAARCSAVCTPVASCPSPNVSLPKTRRKETRTQSYLCFLGRQFVNVAAHCRQPQLPFFAFGFELHDVGALDLTIGLRFSDPRNHNDPTRRR